MQLSHKQLKLRGETDEHLKKNKNKQDLLKTNYMFHPKDQILQVSFTFFTAITGLFQVELELKLNKIPP